jgi:hypothetical protein
MHQAKSMKHNHIMNLLNMKPSLTTKKQSQSIHHLKRRSLKDLIQQNSHQRNRNQSKLLLRKLLQREYSLLKFIHSRLLVNKLHQKNQLKSTSKQSKRPSRVQGQFNKSLLLLTLRRVLRVSMEALRVMM